MEYIFLSGSCLVEEIDPNFVAFSLHKINIDAPETRMPTTRTHLGWDINEQHERGMHEEPFLFYLAAII